jgi:hypothetical protein
MTPKMGADALLDFDLVYVATPYRKYTGGLEAAYEAAGAVAGELSRLGVSVFCPITHSHSIAQHSGLDPTDNDLWMRINKKVAPVCDAIVVARLDGWEHSDGIAEEIVLFAGKPIFHIDPVTMEIVG